MENEFNRFLQYLFFRQITEIPYNYDWPMIENVSYPSPSKTTWLQFILLLQDKVLFQKS